MQTLISLLLSHLLYVKKQILYIIFIKNNFYYLQFIPGLEPLDNYTMNLINYSITAAQYGDFLINLFDLWYCDMISGNYISIRMFDNILGLFFNNYYEAYEMRGICSCQHIIESNGEVYPCDFYTY